MTNEITTVVRMWDKQPGETPKQYAAFCVYRDLPLFGEDGARRTLETVQEKLGYAVMSGLKVWSSRNNWVERANAFDQYMGSRAIKAREVGIEEFQAATITSLSGQLLIMNQLIDKKLQDVQRSVNTNEDPDKSVDVATLKKLVETIKLKDDLARRLSQMPTNYTSEVVEKKDDNGNIIYIVGAE